MLTLIKNREIMKNQFICYLYSSELKDFENRMRPQGNKANYFLMHCRDTLNSVFLLCKNVYIF